MRIFVSHVTDGGSFAHVAIIACCDGVQAFSDLDKLQSYARTASCAIAELECEDSQVNRDLVLMTEPGQLVRFQDFAAMMEVKRRLMIS
jgi:hypothetical protein